MRSDALRYPALLFLLAAAALIWTGGVRAGTVKRYVSVPNPCVRLERVEGSDVYLSSGEGACIQAVSRIPVEIDESVRRIRVFVDGTPWAGGARGSAYQTLEDFNIDAVGETARAAKDFGGKWSPPENPHREKAEELARSFHETYLSPEFQNRYRAEEDRLKREVFGRVIDEYYPDALKEKEKEGMSRGGEGDRLYILASSSVPLQTLRAYASDMERAADSRVVMVFRGFVGGMTRFKPMLGFIADILKRDPRCDVWKEECERAPVPIQVDPLVFRRYGVTEVPAFVYARNLNVRDPMMSEGAEVNAAGSDSCVVFGDVSLEYAVEAILRETKSPFLEALSKKLRGTY